MNLKKISRMCFIVMLCVMLAIPAYAKETIEMNVTNLDRSEIIFIDDIAYTHYSTGISMRPLHMNILVPIDRSKKRHPAILYIFGGGFIRSDVNGLMQHRLDLAERGYVVACIEYRVAPNAKFPSAVEDAKSAVRFLRAHADNFGIDKDKIGVMGCSAGGYLAAMLGTTNGVEGFDKGYFLDESSDVQAVVDLFGVSDLTKLGADYSEEVQKLHRSASATEALWVNGTTTYGGIDGGIMANPEGAKAANPLTYISDKTAPFLLMHGSSDRLVSPSQSEILRKALDAHGIEATRYLIKGADHIDPAWVQPEVMKIIIDFFDSHLK